MNSNSNFKHFSDSLTNSLTDIYRIGNWSLVCMSVSIAIVIIGYFVKAWLFFVGIFGVICCLIFLIYAQLKGLKQISQLIKNHKKSIDLAQETAIELTNTVNVIGLVTFRHIESLNNVLKIISPLLTHIPVLGKQLNKIGIDKLQNMSKHLLEMMLQAEHITKEIEDCLINADTQKLTIYTQKLREISQTIRNHTNNHVVLEEEVTL